MRVLTVASLVALGACATATSDDNKAKELYECPIHGSVVTVAEAGDEEPYEGSYYDWDEYYAPLEHVAAGSWEASLFCDGAPAVPVQVRIDLGSADEFKLYVPPPEYDPQAVNWSCDVFLFGDGTLSVTGWPDGDSTLAVDVAFTTTWSDAKVPIVFAGTTDPADPNGSGTVQAGYSQGTDPGAQDYRPMGLFADLTYDSGANCAILDWAPSP